MLVSRRRGQSLLTIAKNKGRTSLKRTVFYHYVIGGTLVVLVCLASPIRALCQNPATQETDSKQTVKDPPKQKRPAPKPAFTLKVKTTPLLNISLKAEKAKMSEVAQELSKQLKTPVFLGPGRKNETLTVEFSELTLEPALQLLSPNVYVDYEIDTGFAGPPKALAIYLYDADQGEPSLTAVVTGTTQSFLVEGNTEEGVESENKETKKEEEPLRVSFENNNLSVKAKKQPLPLVLLKIGEEIGIPVDIQDDNFPTVDAEISKLPVEEAVRQLSPHIRLFLRADLTRAERRALRLVLASPKAAQQVP
jgi:hypothetical protein